MKKYIGLIIFVLAAGFVIAGDMPRIASLDISTDMGADNVQNMLLNQNPDPAEPGGYVEVRVKVQNTGDSFAEDTVFELLPQFPFSLDPDDDGTRELGTIYSRQMGTDGVILYYRLRIDQNAVEGNNQLRIRYKTENSIWATLQPFDVRIRTYDSILAVDSVESEPAIISPGETAKLKITLKNMADSLLKDIKVNLGLVTVYGSGATSSISELPLTPVGSSNEKTVESLDSGKSVTVVFDLIADADADSKVYKVPLTISYNDEINTNYSLSNYIGVQVGDKPGLTTFLESSTVRSPGAKGEVTVKFVNRDVVDVKFLYLTAKPNGDFELLSNDEIYIGNIDSDDYETADIEIFVKPTAKDTVKIPLHIEYKDPNNKKYTQDLDLSLKLYTQDQAVQYGMQKKSNTVGMLIVLVIIVAGLFFYRRWRKKKAKK